MWSKSPAFTSNSSRTQQISPHASKPASLVMCIRRGHHRRPKHVGRPFCKQPGARESAVRELHAELLSWCSGAPEQDPWASKTSVLATLQEAGPMRAKRPHAEHDAEDPMRGMKFGDDDTDPLLSMGAERKAKKVKKEKKEKKDKDKEKKKKQVPFYYIPYGERCRSLPTLLCLQPWLVALKSLQAAKACALATGPLSMVLNVKPRLEHSRAGCMQ